MHVWPAVLISKTDQKKLILHSNKKYLPDLVPLSYSFFNWFTSPKVRTSISDKLLFMRTPRETERASLRFILRNNSILNFIDQISISDIEKFQLNSKQCLAACIQVKKQQLIQQKVSVFLKPIFESCFLQSILYNSRNIRCSWFLSIKLQNSIGLEEHDFESIYLVVVDLQIWQRWRGHLPKYPQ